MTIKRFSNPRIFEWREHKKPVPRGHRQWLDLGDSRAVQCLGTRAGQAVSALRVPSLSQKERA